jgi:hypothetical protein
VLQPEKPHISVYPLLSRIFCIDQIHPLLQMVWGAGARQRVFNKLSQLLPVWRRMSARKVHERSTSACHRWQQMRSTFWNWQMWLKWNRQIWPGQSGYSR